MQYHRLLLVLLLLITLCWTFLSAIAHAWVSNPDGFWICSALFVSSLIFTLFAWLRYYWAGISLYVVLLISIWLPPWVTADIGAMIIVSLAGLIITALWIYLSGSTQYAHSDDVRK